MKKIFTGFLITLSTVCVALACLCFFGCRSDKPEQEKEQETFVDYALDSFVYSVGGQADCIDINNMSPSDHFNYDSVIQMYGKKVKISEKNIEFVDGTILSVFGKTGYTLDGTTVKLSENALSQQFNYAKLSKGVFSFGIQVEVTGGTTVTYYFDYYSANAVTPVFEVSFDSQDDSPVNKVSVTKGNTVAKPATPKKQYHTFKGWYADKECTVQWDFTKNKIYGDTVIYLKWQHNLCEVCLSYGPLRLTRWVYQGEVYPYDESEIGYNITGWYLDEDFTQPFDLTKPLTKDYLYLYGKGTPKTYTITFDARGGTCSVKTMQIKFGDRINFPTPTHPKGYSFKGWAYSGISTANGDYVFHNGDLYTEPESITVYAKW